VAGFLLAGLCMLEVVLLVDALSTGSDPEVASTETETGPPSTVSGGGAREGMAPGTAAGEGAVAEASPDIVMPPPFMLESPIVSAEAGLPPPLWYDLHRHPEAPCAAIGSGGEAASWTESELVRGYWECYGEAAEAGSGYSLFSMLRGRSATEVGEIRLKITIEDDDRATEARQAFIAHVRRVFEIVGLPAETIGGMLLDGSGRREKRLAGARLMVSEEGGNGRSHNLIVLLPPAAPSFATMPFEYMPRLPGRVARPERRP
jgi:hypothetical protein